jgi:phosphatidylserine/phosphatidylglycerophosphate/cardiolipin synthase-like enzyme
MAPARIDLLDDAIGAGIERLVVAHHRRRLRRHGWSRASEPPADGLWCAGDPPPREDNAVEILVDGEEALPQLEAEIAAAKHSVLLAGWAFEPSFRLSRGGPTLRELLAETQADVRVLAWAGAPLPLFAPSRAHVRAARDALVRGTEIRTALDARERPMAYIRALRSAERLVYLESQFLWAPEVTEILRAKLRDPPTDEFRVVVLLPARPNNGVDDTRGQLGLLVESDEDERFLACTLYQPTRADQVYVHAKIGIVDDRWLVVGSANLNEHSFYNDTEACVITCDEELARATRLRLWREHLGCEEVSFERFRERAEDERYDRLALLPHVSRRTRSFLGPINGLLVDG